ncbi:L,D-transpeptidase [Limoniibacter endophyticus]|uniref:L,D-transpeptidase n=1 Tax=Limoniibacter endophyticus TaxID=1565040 RepID=A0A8J3DIA6_9HYPH|nr:L,D-transpeptidase [Limoniibacter endophyticus]GHC69623.1 L,D-transpeptidase [Limoniibacter endophyticus]
MTKSSSETAFSRRQFLSLTSAAAAASVLTACTTVSQPVIPAVAPAPAEPPLDGYAQMYAARIDEGYELPAIPYQRIDRRFLRQLVPDPTGEEPGTVVVDTQQHFLYLVRDDGQAMRYGVGLGRAGFEWAGRAVIQWKRKWPKWTPPAEMIARQPELEQYSAANGGMEPGLTNPLGARALYIFQNGEDTLYRVHGSPEWWTIGKSVSSGCVRMMNQDVIDLYDRVPNKTPIIVKQNGLRMA